jgi:hypothetical protein
MVGGVIHTKVNNAPEIFKTSFLNILARKAENKCVGIRTDV